MKAIYKPNSKIFNMLPKQDYSKIKEYKVSKYLFTVKISGGVVLLNTLTYELLFLTDDEYELFNNITDNNLTEYLVNHYYYIPVELDEVLLANQIFSLIKLLECRFQRKKLSFFVILTSTACNARCFYCFEKGAKVSTMTPQTAEDVADFIKKNAADSITIQWFGGEPLINTKAIDIICNKLKESKVNYKSTMVSNGYLFDSEMVKKAVFDWKLKKIQVTLDGTEKVYNKIKNYVYHDKISPFKRVLNNIEMLLESKVNVSIRLNLDQNNADDLFELSKILVARYKKFHNCYIYPCQLFDSTCSNSNRSIDERHFVTEKVIDLQNYLSNNMPTPFIEKLAKEFKLPSCMANSDTATMIVPDGHLGKCEHFVDSDFYGSIYSDDYDLQKIRGYKERAVVSEECNVCKYYVQCMHLKCCSGARTHCDNIDKKALENNLSQKIKNICNAFFAGEDERVIENE